MVSVRRQDPHAPIRRAGVTQLEAFAVSGVLCVLLTLTAAAIQHAREAARQTACRNHLRQLVAAALNFESQRLALPLASQPPSHASAFVQLLPLLDASPLFANFHPETSVLRQPQLISARPAVLACPSDATVATQRTRTSYCGNWGWREASSVAEGLERPTNGVIVGRHERMRLRVRDITDGSSQTAMFGEMLSGGSEEQRRAVWLDSRTLGRFEPPTVWGPRCEAATAVASYFNRSALWVWGQPGQTLYDHILPPNQKHCLYVLTASSAHRGGAHCAFADGAARFVSSAIDVGVWRALGTRSAADHPVE